MPTLAFASWKGRPRLAARVHRGDRRPPALAAGPRLARRYGLGGRMVDGAALLVDLTDTFLDPRIR